MIKRILLNSLSKIKFKKSIVRVFPAKIILKINRLFLPLWLNTLNRIQNQVEIVVFRDNRDKLFIFLIPFLSPISIRLTGKYRWLALSLLPLLPAIIKTKLKWPKWYFLTTRYGPYNSEAHLSSNPLWTSYP